MDGRCACFSVCDAANATRFLNAIPRWVDAPTSPWAAYLRVVYGSALALPFELRRLEFFRLGGPAWDAQSGGGVPWPMAACRNGRVRDWRPCAARACAPWLATNATRGAPAVAEADVDVQLLADGGGDVAAIVRRRGAHWRPASNGSRVEVVRTRGQRGLGFAQWEACTCAPASAPLYGCWFLAAVGTGMVLDLRRTLVLPRKQPGIADLFRAYNASTGAAPPEAPSKTLRSVFDRHLAFLAAHAGYETVQVRFDSLPHPVSEVVVTTRYACNVAPEQRYKAFRKSPCVPVPITRANGSACACNHRKQLLNCES